jgi:F-type H+-transporting ATPase subunit epsilon
MILEIISPDKTIFSGEVTSVKLPGKDGYFEVLNNHAPMVAILQPGQIRIIKDNGEKEIFKTDDGFIEVKNNKAIVLV